MALEQVKNVVYTFLRLANIDDEKRCNDLIKNISEMNEEDTIDTLIITVYELVDRRRLKIEDIDANIDLLTQLSDKYPSKEALFERFNWLQEMNMLHQEMPLSDNHQLVMEAFDKFNELIGLDFDAYYTGGLVGYIATDTPLVRYHGDIDILINEEQLESLYELVNQSDDFEFISNMNHKEKNGHEFKIRYKNTPMSIGLFLFERKPNNEIVFKKYNHEDNNPDERLLVDERHIHPENVKLMFSDQIRLHNNIPFKMISLERIYYDKVRGRAKDRFDAEVIKDKVDLEIDHKFYEQRKLNYDSVGKSADDSVVSRMELKTNKKEGQHIK